MSDKKNSPKGMFDEVEKKTNVSEQQIRKLANKINKKDLQDEKKVRQLVAQVSALAGVPVSKEKEDQIVQYIVKNKMSIQEMQAMVQMFLGNKR